MLSFYMDHHVHRSFTEGLRGRGINVLMAFEDGRHEEGDEALLERAETLDRILVSQDDDFLKIATLWQKVVARVPSRRIRDPTTR
jgi:predicted nuclease of predicted toxin-antitoxin system